MGAILPVIQRRISKPHEKEVNFLVVKVLIFFMLVVLGSKYIYIYIYEPIINLTRL